MLKKSMLQTAFLILWLLVSGCSKPVSALKPETLVPQNFQIGSQPAASYYEYFYIDVVGNCKLSGTPLYDRFLVGERLFGDSFGGVRIAVFLKPDHTYIAETASHKLESTWMVVEDTIQFNGLGVGLGRLLNGAKVIQLHIKSDQLTGGWIETDIVLHRIEQTHNPNSPVFKSYADRFTAGCSSPAE